MRIITSYNPYTKQSYIKQPLHLLENINIICLKMAISLDFNEVDSDVIVSRFDLDFASLVLIKSFISVLLNFQSNTLSVLRPRI